MAHKYSVVADLFHVNIEDGPVPEILRAAGNRLKHIHLADSNRQAPGTGHIDFLVMVRILNAMGYTGYMSVDWVPPKPDWKTLVNSSITFMKQMEQQAELQRSIAAMNQSATDRGGHGPEWANRLQPYPC